MRNLIYQSLSMTIVLIVAAACSGCLAAGYKVEYPDKTSVKVGVVGFFKEPTIKNAEIKVGTNTVFQVKDYSSKQDAAKEILTTAIKEAAAKL